MDRRMYQVGYTEGRASDHSRRCWRDNGPRPLAWAAWYPAQVDAVEVERLVGPQGHELFTMGPVAANAQLSGVNEKWPVVLLSHGTGGTVQGLGWLGRRLASRGFISVGVNHHGNTAIEPYLPEGFLCWWERAKDLTVTLNLLGQDSLFTNRLDMTNVFASGFSLGGYTALSLAGAVTSLPLFQDWLTSKPIGNSGPREFPDLADHVLTSGATSEEYRASQARHANSYRDSRIKAVLVLAPVPPVRAFEPQSLAEISITVTIMVGQADQEAPHQDCTLWLKAKNPAFSVELLAENVGHYVFLCQATERGKTLEPALCTDSPNIDRRVIHDRAAALADTLFRSRMSPKQ